MWGVERHRLARPMPPNWRVGEKECLYRLEIGSEIDLVTWQYDLATEPSGRLARRRNAASEGAYTVRTVMSVML